MKVLLISPTEKGIGGVAKVVQGLKKYLEKNGNIVDVLSSENTFIIPLRGLKNPSFIISSFLKTKLTKKKYDIIHAQNPPSAIAMKNFSGKKILSIWGLYSSQVGILHGETIKKFSHKLEKESLKIADIIIVASKEIQKHYTNLGSIVHYIPNALDIESLPENKDRRYKNQIIYAGRLSKEKGINDLIIVCEKIPENVHLIILGNGPEEEKIKEIARKKTNIHYLGFQPKEITIPLIRGSDILIQPSLVEGGLNTTLLEAMACKTTILTTLLDVYDDEISHMKTAYCVKPNSTNELLQGITVLINDERLRNSLSDNAYKIAQKHSWENIGKQYLEIYKKAINEV